MSLWTPYAEAPLDLTKTVKQERQSPPPALDIPAHGFVPYIAVADGMACAGAGLGHYTYPYYGVTSAQMSPVSAGSTCSYEPAPSPLRITQPSPPTSPAAPAAVRTSAAYVMRDADAMSDDPDFQAFERDALRAMAERNGGSLLGNNPRMRRAVSSSHDAADDSYRRQRERNNFAAKQSRDRRKLREIHLALKVAYLKNQLAVLRASLAATTCARCHRPCAC